MASGGMMPEIQRIGGVVLEYIECTHCGKRYAANDKIRASEGKFVRCKNCLEKFMIVVHDSEKRGIASESDEFDATGGWDPTLTAPPHEAVALDDSKQDTPQPADKAPEDDSMIEWDPSLTMPAHDASDDESSEDDPLSEEEIQAQAEAALAKARQEKKKKIILYAVLGVVFILLALSLYMAFPVDEEAQVTTTQVKAVKRISPEEIDKNSPKCRAAAARQWLLDYQAMHEDYDAKTFVNMLEQAQFRMDDVKQVCKSPKILGNILEAATAGEKPDWFAKEIETYTR